MTTAQIAEASVVQPWATPKGLPGEATLVGRGGRPCVMAPDWVEGVMIATSGEWLPLIGQWTDDRRLTWKKFELPGASIDADEGPVETSLDVRLYSRQRARGRAVIRLEAGLPRLRRTQIENDESADPQDDPEYLARTQGNRASNADAGDWRRASELTQRMIDRHIDLIQRLTDAAHSDDDVFRDGAGGGVPVWPLSKVLDVWEHLDETAVTPRPNLVVAMARTLGPVLTEVCHAPRQVLTRQRQLQQAGRVQEVDADCLRWLARQPGVTVAEKAGMKQRAMGIARVEHADTLENRLARDLVKRALQACHRYLSDHSHEPKHDDVKCVARFNALLERLWTDSPIARVSSVRGLPRPNYALQHDRRYKPLWKAYVLLMKQQLEQDLAWRWRQRMFAEVCELMLLAALRQVCPHATALQSDVLLRSEQVTGRFIDVRSGIGRWDIVHGERGTNILLLSGSQIPAYRAVAPFPEEMTRLSPDAVLVCRDAQYPDKPPKHVIGLWTMLDFDLDDRDMLKDRCKRIDISLRQIRSASRMSGLLIQPKLRREDQRVRRVDQVREGACQGYRVVLPLRGHTKTLAGYLVEELGLK